MFRHIPTITIILVWPLLGGVLKHTAMDGTGPIWPFMMISAAMAWIFNKKAATILGAAVGALELIDVTMVDPILMQCGILTILGVVSWGFLDKVAAVTLALASMCYIGAMITSAWLFFVILSELVIVLGMIGAAINGPTSGTYRRGFGLKGVVDGGIRDLVYLREFIHNQDGGLAGGPDLDLPTTKKNIKKIESPVVKLAMVLCVFVALQYTLGDVWPECGGGQCSLLLKR